MRIAWVNLTRSAMSGGAAKHLRCSLPRVARHADVDDVLLVESARLPATPSGGVRRVTVARFHRPFTRTASPELLAALDAFRPDVVFVPYFRLLRGLRWPLAVMIQNMEPFAWSGGGDPVRARINSAARRFEARLAVRAATRFVAVSGFVRDFLVREWSVPPGKVGVVYHGADAPAVPERRPQSVPPDVGAMLFTAGSIRPARGLEDAVDAFGGYARDVRAGDVLAIAGSADPDTVGYGRELQRRAARAGGRVVWLGPLDAGEMAWCYRNAAVFLMTSRVEACPMIALEAMSAGCASIAADNPPLPEIFGDAARFYRPGDVAGLAAALAAVIGAAPAEIERRREASLARARRFTWDDSAARLVAELRAAAG